MTLDNVQALPPGTILGDYRLDAVIGHGGFGITYRAFDSQLAKVVAIKEYLPVEFAVRDGQKVVARGARFADDFAWGRERFLDEARALARFRHPHIVPVLRFLAANGTAYTVMEFEDGRSLGELLRQSDRGLPPDEVRRLTDGLLLGRGACPGLPASRHQALQHHDPPRRRADPDRLRRGAAGDRQPHAYPDQRADAAICADRAVRRGRQARRVERHLLGRRGAPSRAHR